MDPRAESLRAGYAPIARAYGDALADELAGKPLDRGFLDAFAETTRARGRVAEVGCGPGHVAAYLAARGVAIEGLDLSPAMIAEATRRFPALAFVVGDLFALPYAAASLAGVVAFYAIVHTPTAELGVPFRELYRVLAPDGRLALAFHAGDDQVHVDELFGCATALDFMFHPPDAVIAALATAGFAIDARLDRVPYPGVEHPSRRTYVVARRPT